MASGIGRSIYYKRYTKPYLDLHATEAAILFYKTCISSGIDLSQLEQNALNANMTPVKDPYRCYESFKQALLYPTKELSFRLQTVFTEHYFVDAQTRRC